MDMMKKIIAATLLSLISLAAFAQQPARHLDQIKAEPTVTVDKSADRVSLAIDLILDELKVGSNDLIILTPRIAQPDGSYEKVLEPIYIVGGTRDKALDRQLYFGHTPDYYAAAKPQSITRRQNGKAQTIHYSTTIPYDKGMRGAVLSIDEWLTGCADCDRGTATMTLLTPFVKAEPYRPTYRTTYVVPVAEKIKNRSDKYSATIAFRVAKHNIERQYKQNAAVLDDVDSKVRSVLDNKDITLTGMTVEGWASPEGKADYNKALSERRAKSFADYLSRTHGIKRADMSVAGRGEDWAGVEKLIRESDLSYKSDLQEIIDNYSGDARDPKVRTLNGGAPFRELVADNGLYAKVRRTDYAFRYTVRGFNLEEARERIKTNPKLLSLNEMYLVANSYPVGSEDFKEVFAIAEKYYPNEPAALTNAAAAELEGGNAAAALTRLDQVKAPTAETLNNRGIALALTGKYDEAEKCFTEAMAKGDKRAADNLAELRKLLESL